MCLAVRVVLFFAHDGSLTFEPPPGTLTFTLILAVLRPVLLTSPSSDMMKRRSIASTVCGEPLNGSEC